jgi:hypothetical protein
MILNTVAVTLLVFHFVTFGLLMLVDSGKLHLDTVLKFNAGIAQAIVWFFSKLWEGIQKALKKGD